jgi:ketosteroid isomerase-like protein
MTCEVMDPVAHACENAPMSAAENLVVARRYADAWLAGDLPALVGCYHEDFTLHYGGANPLTGVHRGKLKALGVLAEVTRRTGRTLDAIVDVTAGAERAVVLARETFTRDGLTRR